MVRGPREDPTAGSNFTGWRNASATGSHGALDLTSALLFLVLFALTRRRTALSSTRRRRLIGAPTEPIRFAWGDRRGPLLF